MRYLIFLSTFLLLFMGCREDGIPDIQLPLSDIPTIIINTDNAASIDSRDDYQDGTFELRSDDPNDFFEGPVEIRGRGNSTWDFPKKPYQIRFESKESILGIPKDRRWILLANYSDKTMLRNEVAFDLGRMSNLVWTPETYFVELFVNDKYQGVYQIAQKVEETSNRVDVGNDGFLLEVDQIERLDDDDVYFETNNFLFNVKAPNLQMDDEQYSTIKNYVTTAENVLLGNNFLDPEEGYPKYLDVASFVDFYLINEITRNNDAAFVTSVYLNYVPGGTLKMGPIWDFDISMGNINYNGNEATEGFWMQNTAWYTRLFQDPDFVALVKDRFNYFYSQRDLLYESINTNATILSKPQERNFTQWPILGEYVWPNHVFFSTYEEEVDYLKTWLDERMEWLKVAIDEL